MTKHDELVKSKIMPLRGNLCATKSTFSLGV